MSDTTTPSSNDRHQRSTQTSKPRRSLIAASLGAVLLPSSEFNSAMLARATKSASKLERENVELMASFWAHWDDATVDIDAIMTRFMSPGVRVRWTDDSPVQVGLEAAIAAIKLLLPPGSRCTVTIDQLFAAGPMVATARTDVILVPGRPPLTVKVAGVAFFKDGKIVEYTDYVMA